MRKDHTDKEKRKKAVPGTRASSAEGEHRDIEEPDLSEADTDIAELPSPRTPVGPDTGAEEAEHRGIFGEAVMSEDNAMGAESRALLAAIQNSLGD